MIDIVGADGTALVARRSGRGAPVVLIHGSSGGLDSWDAVAPLLTDSCEVWVYARRGYAPSDLGTDEKSFADDVTDLRAVVAAAGGEAHVVGASYGGTVGLHAALDDPSAFKSLAVFEPPLFAQGAALRPVLESYASLIASGEVAAATRLFAEKVAQVPVDVLDALPPDAGDAAEAVGCLHDLEAMAHDETDIACWSGIDVPMLLMQGADSWPPIPSTMEQLAMALPGARRVVLEGHSHFATHTAPELFAENLLNFFEGHSA
jgi:pimeloyl-ACP methyl ester carboxylesterase